MQVAIRPALASDAAGLTHLMLRSSAYQGEYAPILEGYRMTPDQIGRDLVFVADTRDEPVGFYSLILAGEPELDLMFVADAMHGTGLGRLLFEHMRAQAAARGLREIRIVSHPPALGFYERMGAVRVGISPPEGKASWSRPVLLFPISQG
jgi:GNAT superfamily N-acetyltransferase